VNRCFVFYSFLFAFCAQAIIAKKTIYIDSGSAGNLFGSTRDNVNKPFQDLKVALNKLGYEVKRTLRLDNLGDAEAILIFNVSGRIKELRCYPKEKLILFLWEPETVVPRNYQRKYHEYFGRVYTWLDDLVDNKKYFKFFDPTPTFKMIDDLVPFGGKKLLVLLTRGIHRPHPLSLTPERWKIVRFFENRHEGDFDLYGSSWPKGFSKNYKGMTPTKIGLFKNYKFSFCYENMHDVNGYITGEKLFNTMIAGCVPIYWGAKNINTFVPKNCFIDRSDFGSYEELYQFLKKMTKEEYQGYIENIKRYLRSPQAHLFSSEMFIDIVISAIDPDYDKFIALTEEQRTSLARIKDYLARVVRGRPPYDKLVSENNR